MTPEIVESIYSKNPILQKGTFNKKTSGLGLPTVMEYLELLDGQIHIASEPEKGTTIELTLANSSSVFNFPKVRMINSVLFPDILPDLTASSIYLVEYLSDKFNRAIQDL